jgi:hypothetical protein
MIEVLVPLIASLLVLGPFGAASPSPPDFGAELQQLASEFNAAATQLLTTIDGAVIDATRVAYITILLLGALLCFTRVQKRLGRELITGGIILAVLSEFVFP